MKRISTISLILLLIPLTLYAVATLRTTTGFYYPTDKKHADSDYFAYGEPNPVFGNQCHLANDYDFAEGSPVYAVGQGVVVSAANVAGYGSDFTKGGVMVVKHTKSDDTFFYGLYGHIKNYVAAGTTVEGGQKIAEVGKYSVAGVDQPHLHFSINPSSASLEGYTPTAACTNYLGFVDPEPYLIANSPKLSPAETCNAVDDSGNTKVNTILTTANVLTNDTDTDADTLSVATASTTSANGVEVINNGDGTFTYTPVIDFTGSDTFKYTVTDNNGCSDEATFTVTVAANSTLSSSSGGGGSLNIASLMSLFIIFLIRRIRKLKSYE